ncbi:MAG: hypothetical protein GY870_13690, partial [archaeon]|nr:hypothetical protein [archaeon]
SNFIYHLLIGMLLVDILHIGIVDGILFFTIAFLMATISHREETEKIFSDLDIEIKYHETKSGKFLLASSVFVGVVIGIIFEIVMPPDLEFIFLLYSFIAGIICYEIMEDLIPQQEKGNPLYFTIGLVGFGIIVFIFRILNLII